MPRVPVDDAELDYDEYGWNLTLTDARGERHVFNVQDVAPLLYTLFAMRVGPWLQEGITAALMMTEEISDAYEHNDPKRWALEEEMRRRL